MAVSQSSEHGPMEDSKNTAKTEHQLGVSWFMERRTASGPVLPPPPPMTSKQARRESIERQRARRRNSDVGQERRQHEASDNVKKARALAKKAEQKREKARQTLTKKPIKLMEGQGTLLRFGFPATKPRAQVVKDDT